MHQAAVTARHGNSGALVFGIRGRVPEVGYSFFCFDLSVCVGGLNSIQSYPMLQVQNLARRDSARLYLPLRHHGLDPVEVRCCCSGLIYMLCHFCCGPRSSSFEKRTLDLLLLFVTYTTPCSCRAVTIIASRAWHSCVKSRSPRHVPSVESRCRPAQTSCLTWDTASNEDPFRVEPRLEARLLGTNDPCHRTNNAGWTSPVPFCLKRRPMDT